MGCDIHNHIEYKKTINGGPKWICGDYYHVNPYCEEGADNRDKKLSLVGFYDNRNYSLFATLANVRNYGDTPYICNPRGLPKDVSAEVKEDSDYWDCDGHSHSYFTLRELIEYQKNIKPLRHRGMISPEAQRNLDENGVLPKEWCQSTNQEGWEFREWKTENTVLIPLIESLKQRANELHIIYDFLWETNYEEALKRAENIRMVFWFDN